MTVKTDTAVAPKLEELRDAGWVVFDHPGRKLAVYPSVICEIVVAYQGGDGPMHRLCLNTHEIPALIQLLTTAHGVAVGLEPGLLAARETQEILQRIQGGP